MSHTNIRATRLKMALCTTTGGGRKLGGPSLGWITKGSDHCIHDREFWLIPLYPLDPGEIWVSRTTHKYLILTTSSYRRQSGQFCSSRGGIIICWCIPVKLLIEPLLPITVWISQIPTLEKWRSYKIIGIKCDQSCVLCIRLGTSDVIHERCLVF